MASFRNDGDIEADNCADWSGMDTRVESFRNFPVVPQVSAKRLARAGFYFTGKADRVRCFSCQHTVEGWQSGDKPVQRHQQASPACQYLSCVHGLRPGPRDSEPIVNGLSDSDEEAEDMEYRLRRGEVVDEAQYPKFPHMRSEDARLCSFADWPASAPVTPRALAQAGMFFTGEMDRVQCFCCGGMLVGWEPGDDPWTEHEKYYRNCFFVLGHDVGNEPSQLPPMTAASLREPFMQSFDERLRSFSGVQHPIDHERLARAGFYSSGAPDRVTCFRCGGGLKNWQPEEDPWEEHARHYPGCSFLLAEKGPEFVNSIQLRNPASSSQVARHENGFSKTEKGENVMQVQIAKQAVEMGLDPSKVERTILEKIRKTGEGYTKVELLVEDILGSSAEAPSVEPMAHTDEDPLEKLRKLQREKQCKVCMDKDISIVFIPCGHLVTCSTCSQSLNKCPICCAVITQKENK